MLKISAREAIAAGFRLIRREPQAFLVWTAVCFALGVAPQALTLGSMMQSFAVMGSGGSAAEIMAAQQGMMRFMPLNYLCGFALLLFLPPAIMRAVLEPEDRRFLYLRLGPGEWWFFLITIVYCIAYFIGLLLLMIPFFILVGVSAALSQGGAAGALVVIPIMFLGMPALFGVLIWGLLRFSMAPVMAFAQKTFRFTESWTLTRKQAWKMFLVALGVFGLSTIAYVIVLGVIVVGSGLDVQALAQAPDPSAVLGKIGLPWLAVGLVALTLLTSGYYVLWAAAWADMYRQLRPDQVADTFA